MKRPTLSVILSNYNHGRYLPIALQAIMDQSYPPTEVLVTDDASTDNSMEVLREFAARYPAIKIFQNHKNKGLIHNQNVMLNKTVGDFIFSGASDDVPMPGLFEKSIDMLCKYSQAAFCSSLCLEIDENGVVKGLVGDPVVTIEPTYISPQDAMKLLEQLLADATWTLHWFNGSTVVARRQPRIEAGLYPYFLGYFADGYLYHVMALKYGCCFIPEPLAKWRRLHGGLSVSSVSQMNKRVAIFRHAKRLMLYKHSDLFPADYVKRWEEHNVCLANRVALAQLKQDNARTLRDLRWAAGVRPNLIRSLLIRLTSLALRASSLLVSFLFVVPKWYGALLRSALVREFLPRIKSKLAHWKWVADYNYGRAVSMLKSSLGKKHASGLLPLVRHYLETVLLILGASAFVLVTRALRPVFLVRFAELDASDLRRLAADPEMYCCKREVALEIDVSPTLAFDLFYFRGERVCNTQLAQMWKRVLRINGHVQQVKAISDLLPGSRRHAFGAAKDITPHLLVAARRPHISFWTDEERRGRGWLTKMGVDPEGKFVCLGGNATPTGKGRDFASSCQAFVPAIENLVERGYFVIYVDRRAKASFLSRHRRVITYTAEERSDFMNVFLPARCEFFIGSDCGLSAVATLFRRPVVHLNWLPHAGTDFYGLDDIFVPLRLWVRDENRYLTFREMIDLGEYWFSNMQRYRRLALDVCEVSDQDVKAAATEIDERLKGSWNAAADDEELQSRCRLLISAIGRPQNEVGMRIAAQFLRTNRGLFE